MLIGSPTQITGDALPIWGVDDDGDLVCRAVTDETHDVRSFHFATDQPRRFRFEAGQFLTLELLIDGETVFRCYTISSPPTRPETLSITTKRVRGGPVSNWLHDHVRPGVRLRATGPSGTFVLPRASEAGLLLLSGGSGATPLMSMVRTVFDRAEDRDVVFVHSARSPRDIIFRDELALMARRLPRLRVAHVAESTEGEPGWPGLVGRLDARALGLLAPDLLARDVYCCGPAPYMAGVRALLDQAGFDRSRYHEESFSFEALPGPVLGEVAAAEAVAKATFSVTFAKSGKTVACPPGITVLAAAKAAGLRLPSSCTRGVCGTCKSRMLSGRVDMRHGGGIRPREVDQGMVLICCSRPLEDLVIDR
jgi:ferredoxin-NADP reductase